MRSVRRQPTDLESLRSPAVTKWCFRVHRKQRGHKARALPRYLPGYNQNKSKRSCVATGTRGSLCAMVSLAEVLVSTNTRATSRRALYHQHSTVLLLFKPALSISSSTRRGFAPQRSSTQAVITVVLPPPPPGTFLHFIAHRVQHFHFSAFSKCSLI